MDASEVGFPSIGEAVQYIFNKTGLLAEGGQFKDKTEVKSLQKRLSRLSKEEGNINENLSICLRALIEGVESQGFGYKQTIGISYTLDEIFDQYRDLLRSDGTYLSKHKSIEWLIYTRLIARLCLSLHKYPYQLRIPATPDNFPKGDHWFLPRVEEGKIVQWPMNSGLQWVYDWLNISRTRFHYPDKDDKVEQDYRKAQNLENAIRWMKGERSKSWLAVKNNLNQSFSALEICHFNEHRRALTRLEKQIICRTVFIARLSTEICLDIKDHYGEEFLVQCIEFFQRLSQGLEDHTQLLGREIKREIFRIQPKAQTGIDEIYWKVTQNYWLIFAQYQTDWARTSNHYIQNYQLEHGTSTPFPAEVVACWRSEIGNYAVDDLLNALTFDIDEAYFKNTFANAWITFLELEKHSGLNQKLISNYKQQLDDSGTYSAMAWAYFWLKGIYFYREGQFKEAKNYIKAALGKGKYVAGSRQYDLVKFYIELCKKTNQNKELEKGISWANYLGIEVR